MRIFVSSHASVRTPIGRKANLFSFWGSFRSPTARMLAPTFVQNTLKMCFRSGVARIWRWGTAGLGDGSHTAGSRGCQTTHNFVYLAIVHSQFLSGTQRAAQTVLGVYLKLTCSRVTSATSAFGVLSDYALYKSTHSLTHSCHITRRHNVSCMIQYLPVPVMTMAHLNQKQGQEQVKSFQQTYLYCPLQLWVQPNHPVLVTNN